MIKKLTHSNKTIAHEIYSVFQDSYKIEAQLIGTLDFPPLFRSVTNIADSANLFYGFYENECLAGVIEFSVEKKLLDISSLTVDPNFFRKGIAHKLIDFVIAEFDFSKAIVETAVVNLPAIKLYEKHGFIEFKRWTPAHGIEKLALSRELA